MATKKVSTKAYAEQFDRLLVDLKESSPGVTAAAVVDKDGFVTKIRHDFDVDSDALGAAVQIVHGAAQRAAQNVRHGETHFVLSENHDGLVFLAPVGSGFVLAVVADSSALVGAVRYAVKQTVEEMGRFL